MATMVRKQVYLEPRQEATLKQLARERGVTEAEIVRRAIDREVDVTSTRDGQSSPVTRTRQEDIQAFIHSLIAQGAVHSILDMKAWEREKAFIAERMAAGPTQDGRRWRREDAYEERLARYGR